MPTNYPDDGVDIFNEPTLPEETALASAGTATRNHTEHHRDLGDAIEALQANAAKKGHDHSGEGGPLHGPKLAQAQTHESSDKDENDAASHHSLGTSEFQASKGNHTHAYSALTGKPIVDCTSTTRPTGVDRTLGLLIFEIDTYRLRSWAQYPGETQPSWHFLLGPLPQCRLAQSAPQQLNATGTAIEWSNEIDDPNGMFNFGSSRTQIFIKEAGTWSIDCAIQWDPQFVPDIASTAIYVNGVATSLQASMWMRGNLFTPGFSQTLYVGGKLPLKIDDFVQVVVSYTATSNIVDQILSYFDPASAISSRIDLSFLG